MTRAGVVKALFAKAQTGFEYTLGFQFGSILLTQHTERANIVKGK